MLDFFTDISDVADCLDVYSLNDSCESSITYSYDVSKITILKILATIIH